MNDKQHEDDGFSRQRYMYVRTFSSRMYIVRRNIFIKEVYRKDELPGQLT